MILYEKIAELRKRSGLSQEEMGAAIGVSRQAVSKWEMAQTTPDLNKIMAMSALFGVSTDFLLKEEYDLSFLASDHAYLATSEATGTMAAKKHFIAWEEIQKYLKAQTDAAKKYVISVFLFFLSPFAGIFLLLYDEDKVIVGCVIQIIALMIAAVMLVLTLAKRTAFKELKNGKAEFAYGVRGMIEKKLAEFHPAHLIGIVVGIICMIGSVIPTMFISAFTSYNDAAIAICGCLMLLIFAAGVSSILYVQCIAHGYKKILQILS